MASFGIPSTVVTPTGSVVFRTSYCYGRQGRGEWSDSDKHILYDHNIRPMVCKLYLFYGQEVADVLLQCILETLLLSSTLEHLRS